MAKIFLYGVQGQYGNYCAALQAAGLEPVLSRDLYRSFDCAGLLLPGGGDIGAALDGTDQFLIESFTETRRPVLGICRGMQAINVYFGGTLHRWIPGHPAAAGRPAARDAYRGAAHGAARPGAGRHEQSPSGG